MILQVHQWESEIPTHTHIDRFTLYDLKYKKYQITDNEIVIASFSDVVRSLPFLDEETLKGLRKADRERARGLGDGKKIKAEDDDSSAYEEWIKENIKSAGLLHQVNWFRVSLAIRARKVTGMLTMTFNRSLLMKR